MFDLSTLNTTAADDSGIWLPINHPVSGDPLGLEFRVKSKNCDVVRAKAKRYISRLQTDRDFREKGKVDLDAAEAHRIEVLVMCTADWRYCDALEAKPPVYRPDICIDKEWVSFSAAKVKEIYSQTGWAWLRAQVEAAAEDESRFLPQGVPLSTDTLNTSSLSAVPTIQKTPSLAA